MITYYQKLEDKEPFFKGNIRIDTQKELLDFWHHLLKLRESKNYVFRGIEESKYRLYNTSQRYFQSDPVISEMGYDDFLMSTAEVVKTWNSNTVERYLKSRGIESNCISLFSVMQHFGIPTPLLDFSQNPFVALYFASLSEQKGVDEIARYSSLYIVDRGNGWLIHPQNLFLEIITRNAKGVIEYRDLKLIPYFIIDSLSDDFNIVNNINIINQEGIFLFNNHSKLPLEEYYDIAVKLIKAEGKNIHKSSEKLFVCWEINKDLNPKILKLLQGEFGIIEDYLFPDLKKSKPHFEYFMTKFKEMCPLPVEVKF